MNQHRLAGEINSKLPKTYLFIDEAKEMSKDEGSACDRIIADGRKYGLGLVLASQSERHLSKDVIANSASKIVLPVDQTEVKKVANKFRFAERKLADLTPLHALCRFGKHALATEIIPYYQRIN
jgi:DNA helicase HerA-like ATPase